MIPLHLGTADEFAACRRLFQAAGYTEAALLVRHRLTVLSAFKSVHEGREVPAEIADPLELLTRLFLDGEYVTRAQIAALLPAGALDVFTALGLVAAVRHNAELLVATMMLYPRTGLYLASERITRPGGERAAETDDVVFSALTPDTDRYLDLIPPDPCERLLDLGAGTGVAAFAAAARYAGHAWAADLTERATHCAEWNRRLNAIDNATTVRGDLYEPVAGLTFDRIVSHPPWVPALHQRLAWKDGGVDGQEITRREVEGLPTHLAPGGRFYCLSLGTDREGEPFERVVRRWLGAAGDEFDVAFVAYSVVARNDLARSVALKSMGGAKEESDMRRALDSLGVREFTYGATIVQRHAASASGRRPWFTVRRQRGPQTTTAEIEWALRWETHLAGAPDPLWILDLAPTTSPDARLAISHRMQQGRLAPDTYQLATNYPFSMEADGNVWIANLVASSNGTLTGRDFYTAFRAQGAFADGSMTEKDFAALLGRLVSGGFLELPGFLPPRRAAAAAPRPA